MGKIEMPIHNKLATMDEIEKGAAFYVAIEGECRPWRNAGPSVYFKLMPFLALFVLFLQYCASTCAIPAANTRRVVGVFQYVLDYAPLVWLDEAEAHFPSDMQAQISNTHPSINLTAIDNPPSPLELNNLDALNSYGHNGRNVYLTSNLDVTTAPKWLNGIVPDSNGKTQNAKSCAIIINDHGSGFVDAFYMYFYAYNLGNTVLFGGELGDHIGDWEHNMIRFQNGQPQAMWYSQHGNGQAFTYKTVEKRGVRPMTYSAKGSHANYAIAGAHDHTIPDLNLPAGFLLDFTSQGMLWDPTLNTYFYNYHADTASFHSIMDSPVAAMSFRGRWGDEQYPDSDSRQPPPFFGFRKFVGGPSGPWDKQLNRTKICPENGVPCIVRDFLSSRYP